MAGCAMLVIGLLAHVLAAKLRGGSTIAYVHHTGGFFLLTAIAALLVLPLQRFFWRGRFDITLLIVGVVQVLMGGVVVVLERRHAMDAPPPPPERVTTPPGPLPSNEAMLATLREVGADVAVNRWFFGSDPLGACAGEDYFHRVATGDSLALVIAAQLDRHVQGCAATQLTSALDSAAIAAPARVAALFPGRAAPKP